MLAALTAKDGARYYTGTVNGAFGSLTDKAIRGFQGDEGLAVDGIAGPKTRKRLYELYIDLLTGSSETPLMRPDQFLGDPADNANPKGKAKAALQGCGEYNPILVFSETDEKAYAQQQDKTARNEANAPNRRAMIFFFAKDRLGGMKPTEVTSVWPCPAWDEGTAGCPAQFWPDHEKRRANGDKERHYPDDHHTMACAWYDRWARLSPCEGRVAREDCTLVVRPPIYIGGTPDDANLVLHVSLPSANVNVNVKSVSIGGVCARSQRAVLPVWVSAVLGDSQHWSRQSGWRCRCGWATAGFAPLPNLTSQDSGRANGFAHYPGGKCHRTCWALYSRLQRPLRATRCVTPCLGLVRVPQNERTRTCRTKEWANSVDSCVAELAGAGQD